MKLIKAKVYFTKSNGGTHYSGGYPKTWDSEKIPFATYCEVGNDGKDFHYVLAAVPEDLYDVMIEDLQCESIAKEDAIVSGTEYRPQTEKITDDLMVLAIVKKVVNKEELTKKELNSIDSDKSEQGINKNKSFEDMCNDYGIIW